MEKFNSRKLEKKSFINPKGEHLSEGPLKEMIIVATKKDVSAIEISN